MSNPSNWVLLPSIASALFIYFSARIAMQNKQVDMLIHDHSRFDELQKARLDLLKSKNAKVPESELKLEADMFFDRFWSLQFDSFVAWYDGYIPQDVYLHWLYARWRELHERSDEWTFGSASLASSFDRVQRSWAYEKEGVPHNSKRLKCFLELVGRLRTLHDASAIASQLEAVGPGAAKRMVWRIFGGF